MKDLKMRMAEHKAEMEAKVNIRLDSIREEFRAKINSELYITKEQNNKFVDLVADRLEEVIGVKPKKETSAKDILTAVKEMRAEEVMKAAIKMDQKN